MTQEELTISIKAFAKYYPMNDIMSEKCANSMLSENLELGCRKNHHKFTNPNLYILTHGFYLHGLLYRCEVCQLVLPKAHIDSHKKANCRDSKGAKLWFIYRNNSIRQIQQRKELKSNVLKILNDKKDREKQQLQANKNK